MLSVILTVAGHDSERAVNLSATLDCLDRQSSREWELIIVEQTLDGTFYQEKTACDLYLPIQAPEDRGYNAAWCHNVGARYARSSRLLFLDADVVFSSDYLARVAALPSVPCFIGCSRIFWTKREQKRKYLENRDFAALLRQTGRHYEVPQGRGPVNIALGFDRKWYWHTFGGYLENFSRWGSEDTEAIGRILRLTQTPLPEFPHVADTEIAHLYHGNRDRRWDHYNYALLQYCRSMDAERLSTTLRNAELGAREGPRWIELGADRIEDN